MLHTQNNKMYKAIVLCKKKENNDKDRVNQNSADFHESFRKAQ